MRIITLAKMSCRWRAILARRFDIRQTLGSVCDPLASLPGRALRASPPVRGSPRDGVRRGWSLAPGGVLRRRGPAARRPVRARVRGESPTRAHDPRGARGAREVPARPPRRRPRALGARDARIDATPSRRTPAPPPRRAPAREPRRSFLPPGSFSPGGPRGPARSVPSAGRTTTSLPPDVRRPAERRAPRSLLAPRVGLRTRARFDRRRVRRPPPPSHRRRDPPRVVVRPPVTRRSAPHPGRAPPRPAPRPRTRRPRGRPGGAPRGRGDRHRR